MLKIRNGKIWRDTKGNVIHCHGGGFLKQGDFFYWFGENREQGRLVSCYRSLDLVSWEFCNDVVTSATHPELRSANCERPKVLYNKKTQTYVMWLHWENGVDYSAARCGVLISDRIDGSYEYLYSFRPLGHMSRDCTLFKDDDGAAYFISAANHNADLHIYRLSEDYREIAALEMVLWPGESREAPAVFKRGQYYFMVTSGCTGWHPNQVKYAYAESITGEWSPLINIGTPTGYDTQPTYVLPIVGVQQTTYLYVADRWDPSNYHNSRYVFLPFEFASDTALDLQWASELAVDLELGVVETTVNQSNLYRMRANLQYLAVDNFEGVAPVSFSRLNYANENQLWDLEYSNSNSFRIRHYLSGKYLTPRNLSNEPHSEIVLDEHKSHISQEWTVKPTGDGYVSILNSYSKLALTFGSDEEQKLLQMPFAKEGDAACDRQKIILARVYE